jgi:hypothetical protein
MGAHGAERVSGPSTSYLLTLGNTEGLKWVLANKRMAFTANSGWNYLQRGDRLFVYASRAALTGRHGGRGFVIGEAKIVSAVERLPKPVEVGGRTLPATCRIVFTSLVSPSEGVDLGTLAPRLAVFPNKRLWGARLRRSLLRLPDSDAALISRELNKHRRSVQSAAKAYLEIPQSPPAR